MSQNPYTTPESSLTVAPEASAAFRDGNDLIVSKDSTLPSVCIISGQPLKNPQEYRQRLVLYLSPWAIIVSVICAVLAFVFRNIAFTIGIFAIGLGTWNFIKIPCGLDRRSSFTHLKKTYGVVILIGLIFSGITLAPEMEVVPKPMFLGLIWTLCILIMIVVSIIGQSLVRAHAHKSGFFRINKVHPDILKELPEFQKEPSL